MRLLQWEGRVTFSLSAAALFVAGMVVEMWGCAPAGSLTPAVSDGAGGRAKGELVRSLARRNDQVRSLRSLAKVTYWGRDERGSFQAAILVRRPDRLRLEMFSLWGAMVILTADANEVVGFHTREGTFYRGKSSKESLVRYTRIPLELRDLTSLLVGLPPVEVQGRWEGGEDRIQRRLSRGGSEVIIFEPTMGIPIQWELSDPDGEVVLSAVFSDFVSTPTGSIPLSISLESATQERRLEIRYDEPELNVTLPASLFVQQRPPHVRELPLESLGG